MDDNDDSDENDVETVDSSSCRPRGTHHSLIVYGRLDEAVGQRPRKFPIFTMEIGRASCRERV